MPRKDPHPGSISAKAQQDLVSDGIENFELPKSVITKIARSAIPENAKLQKETILSLVKGSTVFVNYLGTAHDVAMSKQHKSISATDVLRALEILELGDLVEGLQTELQVYRELSKTDKSKKGTSSIINPARAKPLAGSASAPVPSTSAPTIKLKLKDRPVGASVVSPYTSTPLAANDSISTGPMRMDVDGDTISQAEEEEIVEDDPSEEEEDLQDTVALEEEELKKDANALEDKSRHTLEMGEKMVVDNA